MYLKRLIIMWLWICGRCVCVYVLTETVSLMMAARDHRPVHAVDEETPLPQPTATTKTSGKGWYCIWYASTGLDCTNKNGMRLSFVLHDSDFYLPLAVGVMQLIFFPLHYTHRTLFDVVYT